MLSGNLDTFTLPDVLRFVSSGGITGRIEISRDEVSGELALDQGRFVATRLGDDEPPSTEDEALDVAVLLFDGTGGSFAVVPEEWIGGPLDLDADELVKAVERRRREWAEVVSILGSLEDPLALVGELPDGVDQVTIRAEQWRLLAMVDGRRSVQDIARDSASSVYAAALSLAEMAKIGMVAHGAGVEWQEPERPASRKKKASVADPEPEEMLAELSENEDDEDDEDAAPQPATVRPLRAATREEQRLRLRR